MQLAPTEARHGAPSPVQERPAGSPDVLDRPSTDVERPWVTIVWNDPVNLMTYVTHVFQRLFGFSKAKATKLMLDVHYQGRAVVTSGRREQMEVDAARLHAAGLWATISQD